MSNGKIRDFDEITSFLGDYGLFQILIMVLLSVSTMPAGYMGVIVVFVSDTPEHYCRSPNSSSRNGTEWEQENGFHDRAARWDRAAALDTSSMKTGQKKQPASMTQNSVWTAGFSALTNTPPPSFLRFSTA